MSSKPWWTVISASELYALRARLDRVVIDSFGPSLDAEREDLVQHALLVLIRNKERVLPDDDGLFRYARRVLHRAVLDCMRSHRRVTDYDRLASAEIPPKQPEPPNLMDRDEKIQKIRDIFCELCDLDRLVLWSFVVDGQSINTIANQLDVNWHQVAQIIEQGLQTFRQHLSD
ncbi:MAG: sigma-70 family RNA polymerase sigma factor [Planctomycetes bacterium]|nr:sigma-70 family RNA polymerase sigma factor [Planctomycetota bacterium]